MIPQKKPYVKPEFTIIHSATPKYNEIMALLKAEAAKAKEQENIPPPAKHV